ncbi:hypothetical protein DL93DRAFT_2078509 [Clavulina sp. PMI_390]|nr:hypothetical protein DL93DRAFT_2078509 [Clavulina sp. PMI_390]
MDGEKADKSVDAARAFERELSRRLRPFAITYALVSLPRVLGILASKGSFIKRLERVLRALLKPSSSNLKLAAFPAVLPFIYQSLLPWVKKYTQSKYASEITAFLSSPAALLLPTGLRVYLAMYTITSAMTTFFKSASPADQARKVAEGRQDEKEWRDYLPPVTVLNAIGNSWMVYSWFHEKGVFPKSYEKLILDHSPHYVPAGTKPLELRDFLETTLNPPVPNRVPGAHQWDVCLHLHPDDPSCTINHLKAWRDGIPQVAKWVAGFGALSTLLTFKNRVLSEPIAALKDWLNYLVRGILYVNGSIQTVWAVTCLLQRLLDGNTIPKLRWIINGSIASLWVYALPLKRQSEISIYVARIGILSVWRAYRKHSNVHIPKGEIALLALGWTMLLQLRARSWKIEGLMRRAITFVEGNERQLEKERATWSPDPSRVGSAENLYALGLEAVAPAGSNRALRREQLDALGALDIERRSMRNYQPSRVGSTASVMSAVTDSGFETPDEGEEPKGHRGDFKIESRAS